MTEKGKLIPVLGSDRTKIVAYVERAAIPQENADASSQTVHEEVFSLLDAKKNPLGILTVTDGVKAILKPVVPKDKAPTTSVASGSVKIEFLKPLKNAELKTQMARSEGLASECALILGEKKGISMRGVGNGLALIREKKAHLYSLLSPRELDGCELTEEYLKLAVSERTLKNRQLRKDERLSRSFSRN